MTKTVTVTDEDGRIREAVRHVHVERWVLARTLFQFHDFLLRVFSTALLRLMLDMTDVTDRDDEKLRTTHQRAASEPCRRLCLAVRCSVPLTRTHATCA